VTVLNLAGKNLCLMATYVIKERARETYRRKIREHPFEMGRANNVHILFQICVHIVS
jgi:hypothetical protein